MTLTEFGQTQRKYNFRRKIKGIMHKKTKAFRFTAFVLLIIIVYKKIIISVATLVGALVEGCHFIVGLLEKFLHNVFKII